MARAGPHPWLRRLLRFRLPHARLVVLLLIDGLATYLALVLAYNMTPAIFGSYNPFRWGLGTYFEEFMPIYLTLLFLLFGHNDLYSPADARRNYSKAAEAITVCCVLMYIGSNVYTVRWFSRGLLIIFWVISLAAVLGGRWLFDKVAQAGARPRPFVVVGPAEDYLRLEQVLQRINRHPYRYVGFVPVPRGGPSGSVEPQTAGLAEAIARHGVEEVVLVADMNKAQFLAIVNLCGPRAIPIYVFSELLQALPNPLSVNSICGMTVVQVHQPALKLSDATVKRVFDLVGTTLALALSWWAFALIALAIKLDSPGPALFRQARAGLRGREFTLYRFRTMVAGAEERLPGISYLEERQEGAPGPGDDDPRVTRVGRALRRASLEGLPQLLNVLKGDMSLVGPRPSLPREVALYGDHQMQRLRVLPGIVGLWQVPGRNEVTDCEDVLRTDLAYIEGWSLLLDIKILLQTLPAGLGSRGTF